VLLGSPSGGKGKAPDEKVEKGREKEVKKGYHPMNRTGIEKNNSTSKLHDGIQIAEKPRKKHTVK